MTRWSGVAEAYRGSFASLCAGTTGQLLEDLPGTTLVDVGCGAGSLLQAAEGQGRRLLGLDPDPDMLVLSQATTSAALARAALPRLPLGPGSVEALAANFVVNHVPDPRTACAEIARVLAPGGRAAVTVWPAGTPAWAGLVGDAFATAGVVVPAGTRLAPELDFARTPDGLAGILEEAGLRAVVADTLSWTWSVPAETLWSGVAGGVTGLGRAYGALDAAGRTAVERAFTRLARTAGRDGALMLEAEAVHVVAQR